MPLQTEASVMSKALTGTGGGLAVGGAYMGIEGATGVNPLSLMPTPWTGAMYGGFIFNPLTAAKMAKQGIFGAGGDFVGKVNKIPKGLAKGYYTTPNLFGDGGRMYKAGTAATTRFGGMLGYKTLLLGMGEGAGMGARASIGNVMLSGIQALGQGISAKSTDWAKYEFVQTMSNARSLGLAGMANLSEKSVGSTVGKDLIASKLYKMGGVDVAGAKVIESGVKGKTTVNITKDMMKKGLQVGATSGGARLFTAALGLYSTYAWFELFGGIAKAAGSIAVEGVGEAARSFFQYVKEIQRPEFGRGRLHMAMASAGAATERQRAVRATYGNKINPTNRLMGTEAMYHHSR